MYLVFGKDIEAPKEPEEQTHAAVPVSPSAQKVEKQTVPSGEEQETVDFKVNLALLNGSDLGKFFVT